MKKEDLKYIKKALEFMNESSNLKDHDRDIEAYGNFLINSLALIDEEMRELERMEKVKTTSSFHTWNFTVPLGIKCATKSLKGENCPETPHHNVNGVNMCDKCYKAHLLLNCKQNDND